MGWGAKMSDDPLTILTNAITTLSNKKDLTSLQIFGVLLPVVLGPGISIVTTYLNGRSKLSRRRKDLEHYQDVLQLVEQASKLSADSEKLDQMLGDNRSSLLIQKIIHDAYATLKSPESTVYTGGYKFFLIRQIPIGIRYYATPVPKSAAAAILAVLYYFYISILTSTYIILLSMTIMDNNPKDNYTIGFKIFMVLFISIIASPFFYALSRFWNLLFKLRRNQEDISAGVTLNGPAKTVERPDFRVGSATISAVVARMGRPTSDQASADGGRTLAYSTSPKPSWLWPVPILSFLLGTIVAWLAGGAVRDVATEGFEFGPNGVLTQTWMSRARPGAASPSTKTPLSQNPIAS